MDDNNFQIVLLAILAAGVIAFCTAYINLMDDTSGYSEYQRLDNATGEHAGSISYIYTTAQLAAIVIIVVSASSLTNRFAFK